MKTVAMLVPPWVWGGNPQGLFESAGLRATRTGDVWHVRTQETYSATRPDLVQLTEVTSRQDERGLQRLDRSTLPLVDDVRPDRQHAIASALSSRHDFVAAMASWIMSTTMARSNADVAATIDQVWNLLTTKMTDDGAELAFPDPRIYLVKTKAALHYRMSLPRVLLRLAEEPASEVAPELNSEDAGRHFASAQGLGSGVSLFSNYAAPLLLAQSPWIWAVDAPAWYQLVIYDLGRTFPGSSGIASEAIQLLLPHGVVSTRPRPVLEPIGTAPATRWWFERLNRLLSIVSDPVRFSSASGMYDPAAHMHVILTVEQVFKAVHSILGAQRDTFARRALMFTALDALPRLLAGDVVGRCTASRAKKALSRISAAVPLEAHGVLVEPAVRAVRALEDLQHGFFMRVNVEGRLIDLPQRGGGTANIPLERAAALYVQVLRDATHGFGGKAERNPRDNALLSYHDGHVPDDLPMLAYVYLLELLAEPEAIAKRFTPAAK